VTSVNKTGEKGGYSFDPMKTMFISDFSILTSFDWELLYFFDLEVQCFELVCSNFKGLILF